MTTWNKELDSTDSYNNGGGVGILSQSGIQILKQDSTEILKEGFDTTWNEEADTESDYNPFGTTIYLATEGYKERLMSEGLLEFLMYAIPGTFTKEGDVNTTYTKVLDA